MLFEDNPFIASVNVLAAPVGAQWELPGATARRNQSHALGFYFNSPRGRAFWPDRSPSCALLCHFASSIWTPSGCCRCWFEKQPERPSRHSASEAGVRQPVPADLRGESETLD